jgi:hypothetical protein
MTDTYVVDAAGKATIFKDPGAVLDYTFDWTAWLADIADAITTHTITVPTGITKNSSSVTGGNKVVAWISGGAAGTTYQITCQIVTTGGRTDERSIYIKVKDR